MFIVGAHRQEMVAEVRETVDPLPETAINLSHLGVEDTDTTWYLEYRYRFAHRWSLIASAQSYSSQGTVGPHRPFNFAGVEFPVGVQVHTEIDVDTYILDFVYKLYRTRGADVGLGFGIHAFAFDVEMEGKALAGPASGSKTFADSDLLAPLPNLRLQAFYAITPRWAVMGNFGWLSANIDEWDGDFRYLNARTHYRFTERFGVSLGYQYTDVDVSRERERQSSEYDMEFKGPAVQFTYGF